MKRRYKERKQSCKAIEFGRGVSSVSHEKSADEIIENH